MFPTEEDDESSQENVWKALKEKVIDFSAPIEAPKLKDFFSGFVVDSPEFIEFYRNRKIQRQKEILALSPRERARLGRKLRLGKVTWNSNFSFEEEKINYFPR